MLQIILWDHVEGRRHAPPRDAPAGAEALGQLAATLRADGSDVRRMEAAHALADAAGFDEGILSFI